MTVLAVDDPIWTQDYTWIVVFACFASVFVSFGIGANDVANAFATSVGSRALTIKQAMVLAAIFEFLGAFLLGSNVMKTIRKDIADATCFEDNPPLLMHGMMCALLSTGFWLIVASYLKMPVSTTHSIIGAIVGMCMAVRDPDCVVWYKPKDQWPFVGGVLGIVLSWVIAPMLSYFFAAALFLAVRTFILRAESSYNRAFYFYPILVWITSFVLSLFMIYKGAKSQKWLDDFGDTESEQDSWTALIAAIAATILTLVAMPIGLPWMHRQIDADMETLRAKGEIDDKGKRVVMTRHMIELAGIEGDGMSYDPNGKQEKASTFVEEEPDSCCGCEQLYQSMSKDVFTLDDAAQKVHDNAEIFEERTELFFRYVQIFTAICNAFAHGANDVANAVGPLAAIYMIYSSHQVEEKAELGNEKYWILALGGIGIVFGLGLYGYKIMGVLGCEMAKMTPTRGFAVELGAVAVVIMGTRLGIPLSTTHCQVGATCGVANMEGRAGVNYRTLGTVVFGWILTLVIAGCTAAMFASMGAYAPSRYGVAYEGMANPLTDIIALAADE